MYIVPLYICIYLFTCSHNDFSSQRKMLENCCGNAKKKKKCSSWRFHFAARRWRRRISIRAFATLQLPSLSRFCSSFLFAWLLLLCVFSPSISGFALHSSAEISAWIEPTRAVLLQPELLSRQMGFWFAWNSSTAMASQLKINKPQAKQTGGCN